jgi:hypothetical protein
MISSKKEKHATLKLELDKITNILKAVGII